MTKTYCIAAFGAALVVALALVSTDALALADAVRSAAPAAGHYTDLTMAMAGAGLSLRTKEAGSSGKDDEDLGALSKKLSEVTDSVKSFAEDVKKKMEAGAEVADDLKEKADQALSEQADLRGRIDEIEQKIARRGKDAPDRKTAGQCVVEHDDIKAFMARNPNRGSVKVEVKAITSAANSAGALVEEMRVPGIVATPERRMTVRDLLTPGTTGSNSIQYVQETGFTNNADVVSETVQKPESAIAMELVTESVATIAHWVQASRQILADAPMLRSYIDGRLRYGLRYKEELQLLNGDGTGINLHGLIPNATDYSAPIAISGETIIDTLRLAHLQSELAEYPSTGQVLHPSDWARIELTKDTQGRYIFANPVQLAAPTLWGRPVVATQAMAEDDFLVGAFMLGAQIFDREDPSVELSTEDRDNFVKNMVTILAEERLALAVYRPEAFVYGDFGNVSG